MKRPDFKGRFRSITLCASVLLSGLGALEAAAQQQPTPSSESASAPAAAPASRQIFFESLDVNLVNVEVYVTDKAGNPITDLKPEDFIVEEDGRPQKITNFLAVSDGQRRSLAVEGPPEAALVEPVLAEPEPEPILPPGFERPEIPDDQRLHLIVYLDNLHLHPFNRNRVSRAVRAFLYEELEPEDRVMVVTFERSIHVRQPFTSDPLLIGQALQGTEKLTGLAVQAASERQQVIDRIESSNSIGEAINHVDGYARSQHADIVRALDGLKEMIGSLGGLSGRKALLYVSDGIPMNAGEDLYLLTDAQFGGEGAGGALRSKRYGARAQFREVVARANSNRVTFYTLDAGGTTTHASLSAETAGSLAGGSLIEADTARFFNLVEPLEMLADDTGGRAFYNTANFDGVLKRMAVDLRSFYSLGYTPAHTGDGRYHRIQVKVKRPGVKIRHRNGYRDKTLSTRLMEGTLASLIHGVGINPLEIEIKTKLPRRRSDGRYLVPFEVRIPIGEITLVPQAEFFIGRLSVVTAVIDTEGGTSPPEPVNIPLEIPAESIETARGQFYVYAGELLMRPGAHQVAVGLRDELSGDRSFVRHPVQVGARVRG